jgi:hypothetical protein
MFVGLLVIFINRPQIPPGAQASIMTLPLPALTPSIMVKPVAMEAKPRSCQPVIQEIVAIAREESARTARTHGPSLEAIDRCVQREQRIDTTGCQSNFRIAERRFLAAEQTLCRDAHNDYVSEPIIVQRAFFDVYEHKSPYDSLDLMSDVIKRDLDSFQMATFDLIEVSSGYGVN